jgi:hypothetical protein
MRLDISIKFSEFNAIFRQIYPGTGAAGHDDKVGFVPGTMAFLNCSSGPRLSRNEERYLMKNVLSAAALLATGLFMLPGAANAAVIPNAASVVSVPSSGVEQIDFRPFRHCHQRRWDRNCHGGVFFRGGHDRRGDWRRGDRRYEDHRRGNDRPDRRSY